MGICFIKLLIFVEVWVSELGIYCVIKACLVGVLMAENGKKRKMPKPVAKF